MRRATVNPAAVEVTTVNGRSKSTGGGIAIDANHVLTCAHGLDRGRTYVATKQRDDANGSPVFGDSQWVDVESIDREADVAVLHLKRPVSHVVPLAPDEYDGNGDAWSNGIYSTRQSGRLEQQDRHAVLNVPSRLGDSGGGIIAQYRGPVVTVGVISATDGLRTFGAPLRAIRRLLSTSRCGRRRANPTPVAPPTPAAAPIDVSVSAETLPHTEPAKVRWIPNGPNAARMHFGIPRGVPGERGASGESGGRGPAGPRGEPGQSADSSRIAELESEVAALRNRLDKMSRRVEIPIEVSPERGR